MRDVARPTVALVSRAFWPFLTGGGIARYTRATAALLAEHADVTVIVPDFYAGRVPLDDPRIPRGVRFEFVPEPNRADPRPFASLYHAWSAAAYEALCRRYPDGGPDLVEFNDYTGEGAVAIQAKRTGAPSLARTRIMVGVHGTDEIHRVLNGQGLTEPEVAALVSLERVGLAGADVIFTPGGDVYGTYERYYGADALAPSRVVAHPFLNGAVAPCPPRDGRGPLRLIHAGRYERRKGVAELILAIRSLERDDVRLTLMGRDTPTGPGGTSMLAYCRALAAGDPRIDFREQADHAGVLRTFGEHDVVVIPARWDTNANTAREALTVARPVLATPTGGLVRIVEHGVNGWLTAGAGVSDLAEAIEELLDDRGEVERVTGSGELPDSLGRSVQNEETGEAYLVELAQEREPAPESVPVGVCVIDPDGPVPELPDGDAVALVPAGAELAPGFVEACARALGAAPDAAYATTWADADEPWLARPLGNAVPLVEREDCGGAVLVVRREHAERALARIASAELAGGGAWLFARELRAEREYGVCVPEELARVRDMPRWQDTETRRTEVEAALRRDATRWTAEAEVAAA
jgi:glycosyltransferase involved in cell wall biosynthesis